MFFFVVKGLCRSFFAGAEHCSGLIVIGRGFPVIVAQTRGVVGSHRRGCHAISAAGGADNACGIVFRLVGGLFARLFVAFIRLWNRGHGFHRGFPGIAERRNKRTGIVDAFVGVHLQCVEKYMAHIWGNIPRDEFVGGFSVELECGRRRLAGETEDDGGGQRVDIAHRRECGYAGILLDGSEAVGVALDIECGGGGAVFVVVFGQAEIYQHRAHAVVLARQHDVGGLDVEMGDFVVVEIGHGTDYGLHQLVGLLP